MKNFITALALVLALCIPAAATDATWAWNLHASTYNFDQGGGLLPLSTYISTMYNGSDLNRDYWMMLGAIGAELDDPKTDPIEPDSATWDTIVNW